MANTLSAKKRVRSSVRKRVRNRATRSAVKTLVLHARKIPAAPYGWRAREEVRHAISALDKAAEKGILHPSNAARRKARLMRALARLHPETAREVESKPAPVKTKMSGKSKKV